MKIAIVVHGRFHAFDLACELHRLGHNVHLYTNYPKWIATRFGLPESNIHSLWIHGFISRILWLLYNLGVAPNPESWLNQWFARWAYSHVKCQSWDIVHCWSGVAEEVFSPDVITKTHLMVRGSAHIREQARILQEEVARTGVNLLTPTDWIIAREEREYETADHIVVLSRFAYQTFLARGVPIQKLHMLPLGVRIRKFLADPEVTAARTRRILNGERLRVLYVGNVSLQKGMWDLARIAAELSKGNFEFIVVGAIASEMRDILPRLRSHARVLGKRRQRELPGIYDGSDLFIFPTLQDGFAGVLTQAAASGLPILATTNCGAPDFINDGANGWILPIRNPEAFMERLLWCDSHRKELAEMTTRIASEFQPRDWVDVARQFESICMAATSNAAPETAHVG